MSAAQDIPDLDWEYPPCSLCDETVESDGAACWCDHCGVVWNADGTKGERTEEALPEHVPSDAVIQLAAATALAEHYPVRIVVGGPEVAS